MLNFGMRLIIKCWELTALTIGWYNSMNLLLKNYFSRVKTHDSHFFSISKGFFSNNYVIYVNI